MGKMMGKTDETKKAKNGSLNRSIKLINLQPN